MRKAPLLQLRPLSSPPAPLCPALLSPPGRRAGLGDHRHHDGRPRDLVALDPRRGFLVGSATCASMGRRYWPVSRVPLFSRPRRRPQRDHDAGRRRPQRTAHFPFLPTPIARAGSSKPRAPTCCWAPGSMSHASRVTVARRSRSQERAVSRSRRRSRSWNGSGRVTASHAGFRPTETLAGNSRRSRNCNGRVTASLAGEEPALGAVLAYEYVAGLQDQRVAAVAKHFAGYVQATFA